jgi:hypothetical protein
MRQMPRYVSHKKVWALQIKSIEPLANGGARLTFKEDGYAPRTMEPQWVQRHQAQAGGFLVQYSDGYLSWSPREAFEQGYTPAEDWGLPVTQEPKYQVGEAGRLVNRETGIAIPDAEPVITFRGKDVLLPAVLRFYVSNLPPGEHRDQVERQLARVELFQQDFQQFVRIPD